MILPPLPHDAAPRALDLVITLGLWELIGGILVQIGNDVADIAAAVAAALEAMWGFLRPIFGAIWGAVTPIWTDVLKPFWGKVQGWIESVKKWWELELKPVNDLFKEIHKWERYIYDASFGPILDTISDIQKFLAITHLSQTAIGGAINNVLTEVKNDVQDVYSFIVNPVNELINKFEGYLLDINGLLSSALLLNSIFRDWDHIWSKWWDTGIGHLTPEGRALIKKYGTRFPPQHAAEQFKVWVETRGGVDGELLSRVMATWTTLQVGQTPQWWTVGDPILPDE